jgi:hypothetical protein
MAAKKPASTFTGIEEDPSLGTNGPTAIKDNLLVHDVMFDPLQTHVDGTPGGIHKNNLQTNSGILTEDDNVILEDANGDLTVTRDVIAGRNFVGPVVGNVTGNVTGNCSGSSGSCTGNAVTATSATTMNGIRIRAYRSTNQSLSGSGRIEFNEETLDPKNKFTAYVATPGIGTYLVHVHLLATSVQAIGIRKNSTVIAQSMSCQAGVDYLLNITTLISITNPADTIDVYAFDAVNIVGGEYNCWIDIVQIA